MTSNNGQRPSIDAHDPAAEEAVIGSCLIDSQAIDRVTPGLAPADFYIVRNGWVFDAACDLDNRGIPIDLVVLSNELRQRNQLDEIGGPGRLMELINTTPAAGMNAEYYADIVREKSAERRKAKAILDAGEAVNRGDLAGAGRILIDGDEPQRDLVSLYAQQVRTLADVMTPRPQLPPIVRGILQRRSLSIWFGSPGDLKSSLLIDLCFAVTTGTPWLVSLPARGGGAGFDVTQGAALWIDIDNGEDVITERFKAFATAYHAPSDTPIFHMTFPTPPLAAARGLPGLADYARSINADLIVIDNLLRVAGVKDENSSEIDAAMANLRRLAEDSGAHVALVHHKRKETQGRGGNNLRGHSSIEAAIDAGFMIERDGDTVTAKNTKARRKPVDTFAALWTFEHEADGETLHAARFYRADVTDPKAEELAETQARIVEALAAGPLNQTELAAATGKRKETVIEAASGLIINRRVTCETGARGAKMYRLA